MIQVVNLVKATTMMMSCTAAAAREARVLESFARKGVVFHYDEFLQFFFQVIADDDAGFYVPIQSNLWSHSFWLEQAQSHEAWQKPEIHVVACFKKLMVPHYKKRFEEGREIQTRFDEIDGQMCDAIHDPQKKAEDTKFSPMLDIHNYALEKTMQSWQWRPPNVCRDMALSQQDFEKWSSAVATGVLEQIIF